MSEAPEEAMQLDTLLQNTAKLMRETQAVLRKKNEDIESLTLQLQLSQSTVIKLRENNHRLLERLNKLECTTP